MNTMFDSILCIDRFRMLDKNPGMLPGFFCGEKLEFLEKHGGFYPLTLSKQLEGVFFLSQKTKYEDSYVEGKITRHKKRYQMVPLQFFGCYFKENVLF